jgi:hypothetical protein
MSNISKNLPVMDTFVAFWPCGFVSVDVWGRICGGGAVGDGKVGDFGEDLEDTKSE